MQTDQPTKRLSFLLIIFCSSFSLGVGGCPEKVTVPLENSITLVDKKSVLDVPTPCEKKKQRRFPENVLPENKHIATFKGSLEREDKQVGGLITGTISFDTIELWEHKVTYGCNLSANVEPVCDGPKIKEQGKKVSYTYTASLGKACYTDELRDITFWAQYVEIFELNNESTKYATDNIDVQWDLKPLEKFICFSVLDLNNKVISESETIDIPLPQPPSN